MPEFWEKDFLKNPEEKERIIEIISSIPEKVRSILEVGCGNGAIVNNIKKRKDNFSRVVGVDISTSALKHVNTEKYKQNINNLKFDNNSFDCVIASEVIEHLTYYDFLMGIKEVQRVTNKWIIISVPNDENLEVNVRMCDKCFCWFNPNYHMNSFNKQSLSELFDDFEMVWLKEIGPSIKRIRYSNIAKMIYHYNKHPAPKIGICPQCGFNYANRKNEYESFMNHKKMVNPIYKKIIVLWDIFFKLFFTKKIYKKRWLLAVYEKSESED